MRVLDTFLDATGDTPLVLLCPAWKKWGTVMTLKPNSVILHSRADDTVPFADSETIAREVIHLLKDEPRRHAMRSTTAPKRMRSRTGRARWSRSGP
jgi:hypothetical protein